MNVQAPWRPLLERPKELLRQVHRRFIWQALLAYLVFTRIAYEVVGALIERKPQLPHSFTVVAIILLIIGLPIIMITAYVQHGIPKVGRSDPTLKAELEGEGEGQSVKSHHPPKGPRKFFTWRNAMLAGVAAFTLWALSAAGWLLLEGDFMDKAAERVEEEAVQADGN
jgi:hypothetical protein